MQKCTAVAFTLACDALYIFRVNANSYLLGLHALCMPYPLLWVAFDM